MAAPSACLAQSRASPHADTIRGCKKAPLPLSGVKFRVSGGTSLGRWYLERKILGRVRGASSLPPASRRNNDGFSTRMVPIEDAQYGNGAGYSRISDAPSNGSSNGAGDNGAATSLLLQNTGSVRSGSTNGSVKGDRTGALSLVNGASSSTASKLRELPSRVKDWDENELKVLPSDEGFKWAKDNYSSVQRTIDVWSFVLTLRAKIFFSDAKWSYFGGFSEENQKLRRRRTAEWVRESILQLGPTFIKLGQLSSTRSDLFPVEYVEELAKLQDRVPAFSAQKSIALIEKELGQPIDELFADFERQPIAAASLGQVHRALLPNGERVVVKVQRPGLKQLFDIDLDNMKIIAEYFQRSETLGGPSRDWIGIYEECSTILYQEIDYINEGRNADRFRADFRNRKWVRVPKVYWDYVSRKVLTLEYLPGIKINEVDRLDLGQIDRSQVATLAIEAYLIQILKTGFFHADPHPGNLAVDEKGSLIYYDFGMMGEIKSFTREKLLDMFYAVYEKDAKKVMQALIELGALVPTGDLASVRKTVQYFLDNLMNQKPDEATTFSAIGEDLFAIALDQPFRFPSTFTFVLRAFSTLEGISYILNPDFSFAKVAAPYAQELLDVRDSQSSPQYIVQELQRQASDARDAAVAMPLRVQRIEDFVKQLEMGDVKLRVRVLEAERAARRASILQMATLNSVLAASLVNVGVTVLSQGYPIFANVSFHGAGVFAAFVIHGLQRIRNLDRFENKL